MQHHLATALPRSLAGSAGTFVNTVRQGSVGQLLSTLPPAERGVAGAALRSSFTAGLNDLMYVTGGLALFGAVCATLLIRGKDFHRPGGGEPGAAAPGGGSGYEPAELVVPAADEVAAVNGARREFAMAGSPRDAVPQAAVAGAGPAPSPGGLLPAPVAVANGAGPGGPAVSGHVRRGDGSPLPGATVTLIDPGGRQAGIGHSGLDGRYQVPVSGPGTYTMIAMAGAHEPFASAVRVTGGPADLDVVLTGASRLTGLVRAAGSGQPLPGVTATLASARGEVTGSAVTGPDGQYAIENLVAGQYTLALAAPSYQPLALPVVIADGQQARADAELRSGARLEGTARNTAGAPVPDARVTLLDADGNVAGVAASGPDGEYSFENLPEGEYTVIATGYPPAASRLKVAGSDQHSHDVELGHPAS
jgi:hypothetical protein